MIETMTGWVKEARRGRGGMMLVVAVLCEKGRGLRHREKADDMRVVDLYLMCLCVWCFVCGGPYSNILKSSRPLPSPNSFTHCWPMRLFICILARPFVVVVSVFA